MCRLPSIVDSRYGLDFVCRPTSTTLAFRTNKSLSFSPTATRGENDETSCEVRALLSLGRLKSVYPSIRVIGEPSNGRWMSGIVADSVISSSGVLDSERVADRK